MGEESVVVTVGVKRTYHTSFFRAPTIIPKDNIPGLESSTHMEMKAASRLEILV